MCLWNMCPSPRNFFFSRFEPYSVARPRDLDFFVKKTPKNRKFQNPFLNNRQTQINVIMGDCNQRKCRSLIEDRNGKKNGFLLCLRTEFKFIRKYYISVIFWIFAAQRLKWKGVAHLEILENSGISHGFEKKKYWLTFKKKIEAAKM